MLHCVYSVHGTYIVGVYTQCPIRGFHTEFHSGEKRVHSVCNLAHLLTVGPELSSVAFDDILDVFKRDDWV